MHTINIKLISRLSNGLLNNIKEYEAAIEMGKSAGLDVNEYGITLEKVLSVYWISNKELSKMKEVLMEYNLNKPLNLINIFHPESDRIIQETLTQKALLRDLLGIPKPVIELDPPQQQLSILKNLALAGLAVSSDD